ncbi:hypothetical protein Tco_0983610, partial [Tanacetum coccineum]
KAKLALLSPGALASSSTLVKNKGLIAETYEWDEEDVSPDDNKVMEVKGLMALAEEERVFVSKECARNREWVQISIRTVHTLLELEDNDERKSFLDYLSESQRNSTDPLVVVIDSSETKYDSADESSVCSTSFPPLDKPGDVEPVSGPMTLKSISTFKAKALKVMIRKQINRIISLEREINPRNPQHPFKRCEVCGSSINTTTDHYDIEWFKRGEALQSKRGEDQKGNMPPNSNRSKNPTKRWVSQQN